MAAKTQAQKIKEAKMIAQYRQSEVKKMNQNRVGSISNPKSGGIVVSSAKGRTAAANSATSSAKTAGRAKNVQGKLNKAAAAKPSTVQQIAKRFNITAREARDIATAVGTVGKAVVTPAGSYGSKTKNKGATIIKAVGDVAKQAGETYTAATKGKSGTSAIKLKTMVRGASGLPKDVEYKTGSKRKQGSKK
jgi:hypothetical protein